MVMGILGVSRDPDVHRGAQHGDRTCLWTTDGRGSDLGLSALCGASRSSPSCCCDKRPGQVWGALTGRR